MARNESAHQNSAASLSKGQETLQAQVRALTVQQNEERNKIMDVINTQKSKMNSLQTQVEDYQQEI